KRPTPITAIAVSTAKPIAKPIRSRFASEGLNRLRGSYACALMEDEATARADRRNAAVEGIDAAAVEEWFGERVPEARAPLRFERIAGGHSNLTYRVEDAGGRRWALR